MLASKIKCLCCLSSIGFVNHGLSREERRSLEFPFYANYRFAIKCFAVFHVSYVSIVRPWHFLINHGLLFQFSNHSPFIADFNCHRLKFDEDPSKWFGFSIFVPQMQPGSTSTCSFNSSN